MQHIHPNGGGRVDATATVKSSAYIARDAYVSGNALVYGSAEVSGNALVSGSALVYGNARVCGEALVYSGKWRVSPLSISGGTWPVAVSGPSIVSIGCQRKHLDEWLSGDWSELAERERCPPERAEALRGLLEWLRSLAEAGCENVIGSGGEPWR